MVENLAQSPLDKYRELRMSRLSPTQSYPKNMTRRRFLQIGGLATLGGLIVSAPFVKEAFEANKLAQAKRPLKDLSEVCEVAFTDDFQDSMLKAAIEQGSLEEVMRYQSIHRVSHEEKNDVWKVALGKGDGATFQIGVQTEGNGAVSRGSASGRILFLGIENKGKPLPDPYTNPKAFLSLEESLKRVFKFPEGTKFQVVMPGGKLAVWEDPQTGMYLQAARAEDGSTWFDFEKTSYTGPNPIKRQPFPNPDPQKVPTPKNVKI